ncbi:hypothetical protein CANARDRAFT_28313 [[Candida] arabinofermentans NRRL YB-2248]|uniref:Ribosomal RNA-processing protein 41 n=1 Tax=[Candida] arabinofermentans NRRL YB-2248 TaxID=983967 RepID=A0A1E4T195_9ASCO|nr:hypothetical protein CANARDRAFT_28313 [[Candida] arabinofermentans NRRL YB-2248]
MSRLELYSPEGIRIDGRRFNELRQFTSQLNTHPNVSDGSSYVQQGNSKVICLVQGPMESLSNTNAGGASKLDHNGPILSININYPPFANNVRKKRMRNDRRLQELCVVLKRCFLKTIVSKNYARTVIEVNITVLSMDGGLLACCCNAITLALIDAGIALYDYVSAISIGLYNQIPLLDMNTLEENDLSFITIGVVGDSDKLNLVLCEDKLPLDNLEALISLGIEGCHRIKQLMDEQVRLVGTDLLSKKQ